MVDKEQVTSDAQLLESHQRFDAFIADFKQDVLALISKMAFTKTAGELLPPWLLYHYPKEISQDEMVALNIDFSVWCEKDTFYWYTLEAAAYMRSFITFFNGLDIVARKAYYKKYDLGVDWRERKVWFWTLFDHDTFDSLDEALLDEIYIELIESTI